MYALRIAALIDEFLIENRKNSMVEAAINSFTKTLAILRGRSIETSYETVTVFVCCKILVFHSLQIQKIDRSNCYFNLP